jgi:3-oxoadipate enol-lactonase
MAPELHAAQRGPADAPVVVLLHPMGHAGTIWDPHSELLSEHFRVIAPDLPGYGKSEGPFTVAGALDGLHQLIGQAAPDTPVHLVGLSLGARIALRYAADHRAASLALLGCGVSPLKGAGLRRVVMRLMPGPLLPVTADSGGRPTVLASFAELSRLDLRPCLAKITVPTLVVHGEQDRPFGAAARELTAGITGAQLRTIPAAGHLWPKDRVDDFVALVSEWVPKVVVG